MNALDWVKKVEELGAGEILLTSMDRDGTKDGYDIELTGAVTSSKYTGNSFGWGRKTGTFKRCNKICRC